MPRPSKPGSTLKGSERAAMRDHDRLVRLEAQKRLAPRPDSFTHGSGPSKEPPSANTYQDTTERASTQGDAGPSNVCVEPPPSQTALPQSGAFSRAHHGEAGSLWSDSSKKVHAPDESLQEQARLKQEPSEWRVQPGEHDVPDYLQTSDQNGSIGSS